MDAGAIFSCILLFFVDGEATLTLNYSCPPPVLWRSVAKKVCSNANHYHCLFDIEKKLYTEQCFNPTNHTAGSQVIMQINLNAERCSISRYQPRPYNSNELNRCIYEKSVCNGQGQTAFSDGTYTTDRRCRCDHQKGYAFVFQTQNRCFCVPNKEDCSCYLKPCLNSSYVIASGYECVFLEKYGNVCSFRESGVLPSDGNIVKARVVATYDAKTYNAERSKSTYVIPLSVMIVGVIALVLAGSGTYLIYKLGMTACKKSRPDKIIKKATRQEIQHLIDTDIQVDTEGYRFASEALKRFNVVIIKGRDGTGKTSMALRLANDYIKTHTPYKFDNTNSTLPELLRNRRRKGEQQVIIVENIIGDSLQAKSNPRNWQEIINFFPENCLSAKVIITTYNIDQDLRALLLQNVVRQIHNTNGTHGIQLEQITVDLDEPNTILRDEKTEILDRNCRLYGRELPSDLQDIVNSDPVIGFPKMCALFCSDDNNFILGQSFFQSPPMTFIDKIRTLKMNGFDSNVAAMKYTVLVYIALSKDRFVNLHKDSIDISLFKHIMNNIFQKQDSPKEHIIIDSSFKDQYLTQRNTNEFRFRHDGIRRAVLITYGNDALVHFIENVNLAELLIIVRPFSHRRHKNEAVVTISKKDGYTDFSDRVMKEYLKTEINAKEIGIFLKKYGFFSEDFDFIQTILKSFMLSTKSMRNYKYIPFLMQVFHEMTNGSTNVLPSTGPSRYFCLTWELITAGHFASRNTCIKLIEQLKLTDKANQIISHVMDEFGNLLLHYFVVWGYEESISLCSDMYHDKMSKSDRNILGFSPLSFAAYLGRPKFFKTLFLTYKAKSSLFSKVASKIHEETMSMRNEDEMKFRNLNQLITEGKKDAGQTLKVSELTISVNKYIVPTVTLGNKEMYDEISEDLANMYPTIANKIKDEQKLAFERRDFSDEQQDKEVPNSEPEICDNPADTLYSRT